MDGDKPYFFFTRISIVKSPKTVTLIMQLIASVTSFFVVAKQQAIPLKTEGGDPRATLPLDPPPFENIFFLSKKDKLAAGFEK